MNIRRIISGIIIYMMIFTTTVVAEEPATWANDAVSGLKDTGYFEAGRFVGYQDNITRVEFIYWAVRLYEVLTGDEIQVNQDLTFDDTKDAYALKAYAAGITNGTGNGNFSPEEYLDRQTMVTFFVKTIQLSGMELKNSSNGLFSDDKDIADWAKEYIYISKENSIVNGVGNNRFDPKALASAQVCMVLTQNTLNRYKGNMTQETPVASDLDERGRQEMNLEEDDVSTTAGLLAFEEKYHLGGYVTSDMIPTKYDINPAFYENQISGQQIWNGDILDVYQSNPPELIGKDGSHAPYEATSDVFYKWLADNDPYLKFEKDEASWKYGDKNSIDYDLERGTYYKGSISIYTNIYDDLNVYDNELDPYIKYDRDATIIVKKWSPVNTVYTKMLLIHYLGKEEGEKAYYVFDKGWTDGGIDLNKGYQFGNRELHFYKVAGGVAITIGEPGFSFDGWINELPDFNYRPGHYEYNPFEASYQPY